MPVEHTRAQRWGARRLQLKRSAAARSGAAWGAPAPGLLARAPRWDIGSSSHWEQPLPSSLPLGSSPGWGSLSVSPLAGNGAGSAGA